MTETPARRTVLLALLLDVALVVAFAATGRASHDSAPFGIGLAQTAWPFVGGLLVGWVLVRAWRRPLRVTPTGLVVWIATVAGGMLLRAASGQGTAWPFIVVTTLVLGAMLVGWRSLAAAVRAARANRSGLSGAERPRSPR